MSLMLKLFQIQMSVAMAVVPQKMASAAEPQAIAELMELAVVPRKTASAAEPMESAVVQTVAAPMTTTVKNTSNRLALAVVWIQAWRMTETVAAVRHVRVAPLARLACRNRGRPCRSPLE